jgi:hypothetical protein
VKLDAMTIGQILEISDAEMDELDESEQQLVVDVIVAVIESELRHSSSRMEDPRKALRQVMQNAITARASTQKMH